ncbi:MAG: hypothetical protein WBV33_13760, partial [Terracidiphilus sp.]
PAGWYARRARLPKRARIPGCEGTEGGVWRRRGVGGHLSVRGDTPGFLLTHVTDCADQKDFWDINLHVAYFSI